MEKIGSVSRSKIQYRYNVFILFTMMENINQRNTLQRSLRLLDTLGLILLTHAQNESRQSTNADRHSSKLWWLDAEMLMMQFPGKELGSLPQLLGLPAASRTLAAKQTLNTILFRFLSVSKKGVRNFMKAKWSNANS